MIHFFTPLEELGGKQGLTLRQMAESMCGEEATHKGIIAKMTIFRSKMMKIHFKNKLDEFVKSGEHIYVQTKEGWGAQWSFDVPTSFFMLDNHATKEAKQYADYLRKEQHERETKKEEAPPPQVVVAGIASRPIPSETLLESEISSIKSSIDGLREIVEYLKERVDALPVEVVLKGREILPRKLTKEVIMKLRDRINAVAFDVVRTFSVTLKNRKDPYAPVRDRILKYCGDAIGRDCSGFKWMGIAQDELPIMAAVLEEIHTNGFSSEEETEELKNMVKSAPVKTTTYAPELPLYMGVDTVEEAHHHGIST